MYEFMKETVIMTSFIMIMGLCFIGIGYWVVTFVNWIQKLIKKEKELKKDRE